MDAFRFENLDIWKEGIELSDTLFNIADTAESKKLFRFAKQLRACTMSITNNIAEGSGSASDKEFASFLNMSRRSLFECVNILYIFERLRLRPMLSVCRFEIKRVIYGSNTKNTDCY